MACDRWDTEDQPGRLTRLVARENTIAGQFDSNGRVQARYRQLIERLHAIRSCVPVSTAVFLVALTVRATYVFQIRENPTFDYPVIDAGNYHELAKQYAEAGVLDSGFFWQSCFYPLFLSVLYIVNGPSILRSSSEVGVGET